MSLLIKFDEFKGCGNYIKVASSFWVAFIQQKMLELITKSLMLSHVPSYIYELINSIHYAFNFNNLSQTRVQKEKMFLKYKATERRPRNMFFVLFFSVLYTLTSV